MSTASSSANTSTPPTTNSSFAPSTAAADSRAAILASLSATGNSFSTAHQHLAADLHANAAALAQQERTLKSSTTGLVKDRANLQREADRAAKGLKQVGDVQNWAEMLERDFLVLEDVLRQVEGGVEEESASGGSRWRG
nr:hypothetical protein CFP56_00240 [Quercus suber]